MTDYDEVLAWERAYIERVKRHREAGDCYKCQAHHWLRGCELKLSCMKETREEASDD